ncbi:hypothetical protein MNBD_GAMMA12-3795, partial [hydrothermal vent metagenome]
MQATLNKIIAYSIAVSEPEKVILFGSMVTGKANRYSDVDLLLITASAPDKSYINDKIISYAHELSLKIDILIYSNAEIDVENARPNSFISAIIKSGKSVDWS